MDNLRILIALPFAVTLFLLLVVITVVLVAALGIARLFNRQDAIFQLGTDVGSAGGAVIRFLLGRKR